MQEVLAKKEGEKSYFILYRMVPPGNLSYFYSVGDPSQFHLKTLTDEVNPTSEK